MKSVYLHQSGTLSQKTERVQCHYKTDGVIGGKKKKKRKKGGGCTRILDGQAWHQGLSMVCSSTDNSSNTYRLSSDRLVHLCQVDQKLEHT